MIGGLTGTDRQNTQDLDTEALHGLIRTWIGPRFGPSVLAGSTETPMIETLEAVVWYCDMRAYTKLGHQLTPLGMIELLNTYLEAVASAIVDYGGEIVKFLGDAVLAIFPLGRCGAAVSCQATAQAAFEAKHRLEVVNRVRRKRDQQEIAFDLALTLGDVTYGVIGIPGRLDLTVVGLPVNLAGRIEELCESFEESVLVSEAFAQECGMPLRRLGTFEVKGFDESQTVYGLDEETRCKL